MTCSGSFNPRSPVSTSRPPPLHIKTEFSNQPTQHARTNDLSHSSGLSRSDYIDVHFWTRTQWTDYYTQQENIGCPPSRTDFVEDKHGERANSTYKRTITSTVNALLNQLHFDGLDPPTWSKHNMQVANYMVDNLVAKYEEFRLCDDGRWKALDFVKQKFPDWNKNSRASGKLIRVSLFFAFEPSLIYL